MAGCGLSWARKSFLITSRRSQTLLTGERECTRERKEEAMGTVSRGFKGRRPCAKLPPGQYLVEDFPILSAGPTPSIDLEAWALPVTRFSPRAGPTCQQGFRGRRLRDHGQEG